MSEKKTKSTVDVGAIIKRKKDAEKKVKTEARAAQKKKEQIEQEGEFKEINPVELSHAGIVPAVAGEFTEKQLQFLQLYIPYKFNVTVVCQKIGITRTVFNKWMQTQPEFKNCVDELREFIVDYAEAVLLKALDDADVKAAQFILKTVGKHRGYVENVDITSNGHTLGSVINIIPPSEQRD